MRRQRFGRWSCNIFAVCVVVACAWHIFRRRKIQKQTVFFLVPLVALLSFTTYVYMSSKHLPLVKFIFQRNPTKTDVGYYPSNINWFSHCNTTYRESHWVAMAQRARTGNHLFQLFCVLALSRDFCYTPVLDTNIDLFDNIFKIYNVKRMMIDKEHFQQIGEPKETFRRFNRSFYNQLDNKRNWTIHKFHQSYKYFQHQEEFIKSSVRFKPRILEIVNVQLANFTNNGAQVCTIHVRRTDLKRTTDLWYINHINKSINYVRNRITSVRFVFVSDDLKWCKKIFKSPDMFHSPLKSPGQDLALMALSDHVILTRGTFGWMGAWLGNKGDNALVLIPSDMDNASQNFYPPSWIRI